MTAPAPFRRAVRAIAVASAVTLGGACYHAPALGSVPRSTVVVENQSFYDYNIYVVPEGAQERRLGFARSKSTTRFTIPADVLPSTRSLRFEARPIATQTGPVSEQIVMTPGDEVGLQIPPA